MNVVYNSKLLETLLKDFDTSGITNKAIQSGGTGRCTFERAILNYPASLLVVYDVESSNDNGPSQVSANGQPMSFLNKGYTCEFQFYNIQNLIQPNFTSLPYSQQEQIIQNVFDQADVKVNCNCSSFYWQGMEEEDDKHQNTYRPFTGQPGKDIWQSRHEASGNVRGQQLCKHLWAVTQRIDKDIPEILKSLGGASSVAGSSVTDEELDMPEQNAGQPNDQPMSAGGIKSKKVEPEEKVADAVNPQEATSAADKTGLPKLDTTQVNAKNIEADTEVQEGPENVEPPIEELTKPVDIAEKDTSLPNNSPDDNDYEAGELEDERQLNESQLREEYIPLDYDRSIQKVINRDTREPFDDEFMRDLMRIRGNKSWFYAKPHQDWISNGEEYIIEIAKDYRDGDAETFLITHKYGITPVGGIAFYLSELSSYLSIVNKWLELPFSKEELEGQKFVSEIALIGFRENDITLVKDCFNLVDKMLEKYKIIVWNVHNENTIKRAYDKIIQRYDGISRSDDRFTQYAIVCKGWRDLRDKRKLNEVYARKDRAFIIDPNGQVFSGPLHETILKNDFPEMWEEMYNYCVEKDFGTEDLQISGMIQRKMYRRDYIKIMCKTSGPLEVWIVLERMRKKSYNDIVKWANAYLNDVYDGKVHIMLDDNRQQYDCTLKELADDMMIEQLLESKAEDQFQQIYDDLTDAHGYLADESNKWRYRNLARNVKDIRDDFEFIYNQAQIRESKLDYWQERLEQLDFGSDEWFKAKSERDEILRNHGKNPTQLDYWGTCVEVGSHKSGDPWGGDVTNMANDLGPYVLGESEDEDESNYEEISEGKFFEVAQEKALPDHEFIFFKRYDDSVYIAYDIDSDIHYIWW